MDCDCNEDFVDASHIRVAVLLKLHCNFSALLHKQLLASNDSPFVATDRAGIGVCLEIKCQGVAISRQRAEGLRSMHDSTCMLTNSQGGKAEFEMQVNSRRPVLDWHT